jgi:hypothetical protein
MEEVQALVHITNLIEDKGVDKCTPKTQEAYEILKELAHKLETEFVIYRP